MGGKPIEGLDDAAKVAGDDVANLRGGGDTRLQTPGGGDTRMQRPDGGGDTRMSDQNQTTD